MSRPKQPGEPGYGAPTPAPEQASPAAAQSSSRKTLKYKPRTGRHGGERRTAPAPRPKVR